MFRKKKESDQKKFMKPDLSEYDNAMEKNYDLKELYGLTYQELGLQQSKRDALISLYMALFAIIVPATLSLMEKQKISNLKLGFLLLVAAVIGILMGNIIIRYRIYKEAYWISCACISQLKNYKVSAIDKSLVQGIFYEIMEKKFSYAIRNVSVTDPDTQKTQNIKKLNIPQYIKKTSFSAETSYFIIHAILTAIVGGFSTALIIHDTAPQYSLWIGGTSAFCVFLYLLIRYFDKLYDVYKVLIDDKDSSFNGVFEKAWLLHFYRDPQRVMQNQPPLENKSVEEHQISAT